MSTRAERWRLTFRYCARACWRPIANVGATLLAPIGFGEVLLFAGCGLLGYGLSFVYLPAAFAVPGAILAGVAIFGVK